MKFETSITEFLIKENHHILWDSMTVFEDSHPLKLNQLTVPKQVFHIQGGNTFCSNDQILLLQDDSTTVEFRLPPKFQSKRIPWRFGLVRDIVWCSKFDVFLLLTRNALHSLSPKSMFISSLATNKPLEKYPTKTYKRIRPFKQEILFWRCACADTTLYITYAGMLSIFKKNFFPLYLMEIDEWINKLYFYFWILHFRHSWNSSSVCFDRIWNSCRRIFIRNFFW